MGREALWIPSMNHYSNLYDEIAEAVPGEPPSFEQLIKMVRDLADDPEQPVADFTSFEEFFAWFDTLTGYDQFDLDEDVLPHKLLLEVVYDALLAEQ